MVLDLYKTSVNFTFLFSSKLLTLRAILPAAKQQKCVSVTDIVV
jgi:hypothetical protein